MPRALKTLGVLAFSFFALSPIPSLAKDMVPKPRLVLVLVADQLGTNRIHDAMPGGLGKLAREGQWFQKAQFEHAVTETCPGHSVVLSGQHPGTTGITANRMIEARSGRSYYCVEDDSPGSRTYGASEGRSPRLLKVTTFGDWLKQESPGSKVFAVSGKDRSAILLAGKQADAAFWIETSVPGFTTSAYYPAFREASPEWLSGQTLFRAFLKRVPRTWVHSKPLSVAGGRIDDYPAESGRYKRRSGHPLRFLGSSKAALKRIYFSPFLDELVLDFASDLIRREKLGEDAVPDVLAVSLSATDYIGHLYGPESHEAADALVQLDRMLGAFLESIEAKVGRDSLLVVLTSDHGVMPLPEWLRDTGRSRCSNAGGRVALAPIWKGLLAALDAEFASKADRGAPWFLRSGYQLTANRALLEKRGIELAAVLEKARDWLSAVPTVEHVWTAEEILHGKGRSQDRSLYQNGFDPERSGDLIIQPKETCLFSNYETGTSHGSPHHYDRAVPLIFYGAGVGRGKTDTAAGPVDIAPTLAEVLGIEPPEGLAGRPLPLNPGK